MSTIYGRLGYDSTYSGNNVTDMSSSANNFVNTLPKLVEKDWQIQDIANANTSGYYKNPVNTQSRGIWSTANSIIAVANIQNVANLNYLYVAANTIAGTTARNFQDHTDRISGVVQPYADTATYPHLQTALNTGQMLIYLTSQSDGISNNSPIMGNFTSLTTANQLGDLYNTIIVYPSTIANSINVVTTTDGGGNTITTYTTNLSNSQIVTFTNNLNTIIAIMNTRRTADENFYYNSQDVLNDYHTVKQFNKMGSTQTYLIQNLVGSDKLLSRLNS